MSDIVYFELNDWTPGKDYPDVEPFCSWMQFNEKNNYNIAFRNEEWIKENKLVVVESLVDMSMNFCISATKQWVDENCPQLLTTYKEFIRKPVIEDDYEDLPEGRFGCPFLEYNEENIGYHYDVEEEDNQGYTYYSIDEEE